MPKHASSFVYVSKVTCACKYLQDETLKSIYQLKILVHVTSPTQLILASTDEQKYGVR